MDHRGEDDLLRSAAEGDEDAFGVLFRRYQRTVYQFAWRMAGSPEAAEDLTQECFFRVLRSAKNFDPGRGPLRSYLLATVRNLAVRSGRTPVADDSCADELVETTPGPEHRLLGLEASEQVERAVAMLPAAQREVLVLIEYEGLSAAEAASVLEVDANAVKSRLYRARQNLKKLLAPYFGRPQGRTMKGCL